MKFREIFAVFTPWNEQICSYGYGTLAAIKNKWDTIKSGDKFSDTVNSEFRISCWLFENPFEKLRTRPQFSGRLDRKLFNILTSFWFLRIPWQRTTAVINLVVKAHLDIFMEIIFIPNKTDSEESLVISSQMGTEDIII